MNGKIQLLPEHVSNKIAAGEVVERPASVVKELVENALDAGARRVVVNIVNGGKDLIQVIDDGEGMTRDDAMLAFKRHATSKITSAEDLERINTFGFRGEALSSISSVAQVELKSKTEADSSGWLVRVGDGVLEEAVEAPAVTGTTITVKQLFYNVPARRHFLKTRATELRHTINTLKRFALAYPMQEFVLISNDNKVLDLKPADLESRLRKVVGSRIIDESLELDYESNAAKMTGRISKPNWKIKTKGDQYFFVNRRPVVNKLLNAATYAAYEHMIPKGDFPFYCLFLELEPEAFDVNVHPTKAEIRFREERFVYHFFFKAMRESMTTDEFIPMFRMDSPPVQPASTEQQGTIATGQQTGAHTLDAFVDRTETALSRSLPTGVFQGLDLSRPVPEEDQSGDAPSGTRIQANLVGNKNIWQLHNKYIVSQIKSGMAIIDQHVAHERILYEKALQAFEEANVFSQQLLFPEHLEFGPEEFAIVQELSTEIEKLGFVVRFADNGTVIVDAVPGDVRIGSEKKILREMIAYYRENEENSADPRDNLAKSFSCKTAVKSGEPLTLEEMNALIDQLFATRFPYVCPHGRPVIIQLSMDELDRKFMRK